MVGQFGRRLAYVSCIMPKAALKPTCPKCGSASVRQIGVKRDRCFKPFTEGDVNDTLPAVTYAFQCECGVAFTETARQNVADKLYAIA